ncbi:hypothetical protein KPH14_001403 [Odynerus spinipes]|uniref:Large ribosomal subunit protein uL1 n=1 Tax=Odynerus spinipes TaxID=1348599 RepID=A0AAD9VT64_9HYME|nr:hypothetical protein KPH14_001403 [Odynerus spinipes]
MTSKVSRDTLYECVNGVLQHSQDKKRNFLETVELQIGLKNYDPQKDKRFSGTVKLKNIPRPKMQVCVLGDQQHCDEAKANNIPYMDAEALKKLNKNKKFVKKLAKKYDAFLASESLIKQIPRLLGPGLNKAGKFPGLLSHQESMVAKIDEVKATIKFQMKKVLCLSVAVGHVEMTPDELVQNVHLSINFLVSLLKKHWQNEGLADNTSKEMIPRKRLHLLLYILRVFYVFGEEDAGERNLSFGVTPNDFQGYLSFDKDKSLTKTEEETYSPTRNSIVYENDVKPFESDIFMKDDFVENNLEKYPLSTLMEERSNVSVFSDDIIEVHLNICDQPKVDNGSNVEIGDVKDLKVETFDTERILISWKAPCPNLNNIPINYTVTIYDGEIDRSENVTSTQPYITYNATELNPCTSYTFIVTVVTGHWKSNGVNVTQATSSNITFIEEVQHIQISELSRDEINDPHEVGVKLTWDAPQKYINCINDYKVVQYTNSSYNESIEGTPNTTYIARKLNPCTEYTFIVKVVSLFVESVGVNASHTTRTIKPSEPVSLTVVPDDFALKIYWQPPLIGSQCVEKYRVTVSDIMTEHTQDTSMVVTNLKACTLYEIYIIAVNKESHDGKLATTSGRTKTNIMEPPILRNTTSGKFNLSTMWNIENVSNNTCKLQSLLVTCNYMNINGDGYEPVSGYIKEALDHVELPIDINVTVTNLTAYTTYTCQGIVINEAGNSSLSESVVVTTLQDISDPPIITVTNVTNTQFTFVWEKPKYLPGVLTEFQIEITWASLFLRPDWCTNDMFGKDTINITGLLSCYEYLKGKPYTSYNATIKARTDAGWSKNSELVTFITPPGVPEAVSNFTYVIQENKHKANLLDTLLTWNLPCFLNGQIESFLVSIHGTRTGYDPHILPIEKTDIDSTDKNVTYSMYLPQLKAEYNYTFTISAKVNDVNIWGVTKSHSDILYPAGIPPELTEEYIKSITIDAHKARRSTTSVTILLPLFSDDNGDIKYYAIMVSRQGFNQELQTRFNLSQYSWPNVSSWKESMENDFSIPYQATRPKWHPFPSYVADYGHIKAVKYVLGDDTNCKEISSKTDGRVYCNGPLKPDTWYHVTMRAFTSGGFRDSSPFLIKTNAELDVGAVIGIVLGILFMGILTTTMLLVRKCSPYTILRRLLHSEMPGSPLPAPFTRKKFLAHCQQLIDNPGKLSNEFRLLQTLSVDLQMPSNTGCLQANRKKNRYSDILPYDFSRVKLEIIDNDPNTDYINASFIKGYSGEDEYIACQGPKEDTTYDFWRMIDQYEVNIIVMLTQLVEKGKVKCHQYYPVIRETFGYENITIRCTSELDFRTYTQRTLILQKENKKRTITHFHFKDWPDHDVPEDFDSMINFCQILRRHITANKGFVVIHCSAGIGRTGTLIAIDILLQHLRDNRKLDVFGTVYRLRHHRINMVQRESQYAFIYNCIKQVVKNPYFLKTYKPPPVDPVSRNLKSKILNLFSYVDKYINECDKMSIKLLKEVKRFPYCI